MKLIYLISLALFATATAHATASNMSWATHLSPDFVMGTPPAMKAAQNNPSASWNFAAADACEEHIAKAVCRVKSLSDNGQCLEVPGEVFENLRAVYQRLAPPLQTMFCKVPQIFIADEMASLAMAGYAAHHSDPTKVITFMAISTSLVAENQSADAVFGWKEQRMFGAKSHRYEVQKSGPLVSIRTNSPIATLQYVITHELAHLFDYLNAANKFECHSSDKFDCRKNPTSREDYLELLKHQTPIEDSWGSLSWKTGIEPNEKNNFPLQSKLCFYGCTETLKLSDMSDFYLQLDPTSFVTSYAASNPMDDFAESVAFYFMTQADDDLKFRISTGRVIYFNEWRWSLMQKKHNWIELFFEGDLKYPQ
ncbi:hypothetical protein [Bdellovibrio sp. HCB209]|uniref:hypothetical protein n=1 Tax=Bdellovibrio sp. HCB209 TaxID=3394354 RepID=UPI0039B550EA